MASNQKLQKLQEQIKGLGEKYQQIKDENTRLRKENKTLKSANESAQQTIAYLRKRHEQIMEANADIKKILAKYLKGQHFAIEVDNKEKLNYQLPGDDDFVYGDGTNKVSN